MKYYYYYNYYYYKLLFWLDYENKKNAYYAKKICLIILIKNLRIIDNYYLYFTKKLKTFLSYFSQIYKNLI